MILILLSFLIIFPAILGFGNQVFRENNDEISLIFFKGILFLGSCFTLISFFSGLNIFVEILTLFVGIFLFVKSKNYQKLLIFKEHYLLILFGFVAIFFSASFAPYILDFFGYYLPTINWLREIGVVKGISNLDLLLGQMSFWHILQAGFSNFSDVFLRLNAIFLIAYFVYIIEKKHWLHLIFLPVLLLFSQSPSSDLPVIVLSLVIVDEIFSGNKNVKFLFALSVFVFCIKPTAIWLPIFVGLIFFSSKNKKYSALLPGILIGFLFVFKNFYAFGFPIFPVSAPTFLQFPWSPNPEILRQSSEVAILKTYDMQYSIAEISKFSSWNKIINWFTLAGIKGKINILFILSLIILTIYCIKSKSKILYFLTISILIKSVLVLLFSAQYRFFLEVFFVVIFIIFRNFQSKKVPQILFFLGSVLVCLALSFPKIIQNSVPSFRLGNYMQGFSFGQIYKPATFELKKFRAYTIGNMQFNFTKDYPFMFDTPLPAISQSFLEDYYKAGIFPQKIGKDLKNGFIWKKLDAEEKLKLKQIIDENSVKTN